MGKMLLILGLTIMFVGAVLLWAPWLVQWFGRLPGDIRVERPGFRFYFPITTMILVSVVLSLLLRLLGR